VSVVHDRDGLARIVPSSLPVVRSERGLRSWSPRLFVAACWRRIRLFAVVRWGGAWLDHELASGVSPETSEALATRARRITGQRSRADAASRLIQALFGAEDAAPGFTAAEQAHHRELLAARTVIAALDRRLRAPEPVAPRGMAMLNVLLTNGTRPLYQPGEPGGLGEQLRAAAAALQADNRPD
jgi:hypothetical protein